MGQELPETVEQFIEQVDQTFETDGSGKLFSKNFFQNYYLKWATS